MAKIMEAPSLTSAEQPTDDAYDEVSEETTDWQDYLADNDAETPKTKKKGKSNVAFTNKGHGAKHPVGTNGNKPAHSFEQHQYHTAFDDWETEDVTELIVEGLLDGSEWDGDVDGMLPTNPHESHYTNLVYEVTDVIRFKRVKHELPLATWTMVCRHDGREVSYVGYRLRRKVDVKAPAANGKLSSSENTFQMVRNDMEWAYGFTRVSHVPYPDETRWNVKWSGEDWMLSQIRAWQLQHKFWQNKFIDGSASKAGSANTEAQQRARAENGRKRALTGRLSQMRAYKLLKDSPNLTPAQMAKQLNVSESYLPKLLKLAKDNVPNLTQEEKLEAVEYAKQMEAKKLEA